MRRTSAVVLLVLAAGCRQHNPRVTPVDAGFTTEVAGTEWSLLELSGRPVPGGAGGQRPTIRFAAVAGRADGFTGCNQFHVTYLVAHDSLRFEPPALTRMACTAGTDLERSFLAALRATEHFRIADGDLLLVGASGPVARFTRGGN